MTFEKNISNFIFSQNTLIILDYIKNQNKPIQFKELRDIKNPKTNKKFSSATVSKTLKELEENKLIDNEIIKIQKRKTLGYITTEKGNKTINLLKETQEKLEKL